MMRRLLVAGLLISAALIVPRKTHHNPELAVLVNPEIPGTVSVYGGGKRV